MEFGGFTKMGTQKSHSAIEAELLDYLSHLVIDLYEAIASARKHVVDDLTSSDVRIFARLPSEAKADMSYLRRRTKKEGIAFLTSALPKLDEAFLRYEEDGRWHVPVGFAPHCRVIPDGICVPRFLRAFWILVLLSHRGEGDERWTDLARVIRVARSIFRCCYKLDLPFSEELVSQQLEKFVATDAELTKLHIDPENLLIRKARRVVANVLRGFAPMERSRKGLPPVLALPHHWLPRHGPGAVASGERDEQKWAFGHKFVSLNWAYPYYDIAYGMRSNGLAEHLRSDLDRYRSASLHEYATAKLVAVPKDARGPRLISEEPLELQYMQQAVARPLMRFLESQSAWSRGRINFADQQVNGKLALASSADRQWATLDLKDASDRVSLSLFRALWPKALQPMFMALRSYATALPDGREVWLEKYAPMGSALCFPVESLLFYAISVASLSIAADCSLRLASHDVYVYGDDIVVPSRYAYVVMEDLESAGLLVNWQKSFVMGHFRESCGTDAWHGRDVTPLKLRRVPGRSPAEGENILAWCSYADTLWGIRCRHALSYVESLLEGVVGWIPVTDAPVGYLSYVRPGRATGVHGYPSLKVRASLQRHTSMLYVPTVKRRDASFVDGWQQLMRGVISPARDCDPSRIPVRGALSLRRRRVIVQA